MGIPCHLARLSLSWSRASGIWKSSKHTMEAVNFGKKRPQLKKHHILTMLFEDRKSRESLAHAWNIHSDSNREPSVMFHSTLRHTSKSMLMVANTCHSNSESQRFLLKVFFLSLHKGYNTTRRTKQLVLKTLRKTFLQNIYRVEIL